MSLTDTTRGGISRRGFLKGAGALGVLGVGLRVAQGSFCYRDR